LPAAFPEAAFGPAFPCPSAHTAQEPSEAASINVRTIRIIAHPMN
jgi:hypothetical protein